MKTATNLLSAFCLALLLFTAGARLACAQTPSQPSYPVYRVTNAPASPSVEAVPASGTSATPAPPPSAPAQRSAAELEKLAAPIAIYPDPLIAVILPAAVYPVEVVQAARFVKDTNNIPKVDEQPWDEKVRAVAKFPEVIAKMDADLTWTVALGQAFLEQSMELMEAIQGLRAKAQAAGKLKTTSQQVVTVTNAIVERTYENQIVYVTNTVIQVQPASPQVVYVPSYNPSTVYVHDDHDDEMAAVVTFGAAIAVGAIIANNCDWHYGGCYWGGYPPPPPPMPPPYHPPPGPPPPPGGRPPGMAPPGYQPPGQTRPPGGTRPPGPTMPAAANASAGQRWQPDQSRLSKAGAPSATTQQARGWGSGGATPGTGNLGARPSTGAGSARPSTGTAGTRPSTGSVGTRPSTGTPSASRPSTSPSVSRSSPSAAASRPSASPSSSFNRSSGGGGGSAFGGMSSGSSSRSFSSRGASSRSGGFSGGGRGGGGRR